ncbi:MAG: hypothetical protein COZ06_26620, partial [Armatimonadetes bacterium CG_4_10_14_3_um_filter_66_18]
MRRESEGLADYDRRKFLRQSAEVAAAALFGGAALDGVIDAVLKRVDEHSLQSRTAAGVLADLRRFRDRSVSWADC